jgi:ADP-ribose pyrophosphatase
VLQSHEVFSAESWFKILRQQVGLPDGRIIDDYHHIEAGKHVATCAETTDGLIILVRQYRHGPGCVCLGLPAGAVTHGELPLVAAQRELLEETGYIADEWQGLGQFAEHGNYGCGTAHLFKAKQARLVAMPNSGDLEDMEVVLLSIEELQAAIRNNQLPLLGSVAAIALAIGFFS